MKYLKQPRQKRLLRTRSKVRGSTPRPRLSVFRSHRHIFAQIIDDQQGITLVSVSDQEIKPQSDLTKTALAQKVGQLLAQKAIKAKITQVVFDRGLHKFHGRLKALAESSREGGLKF